MTRNKGRIALGLDEYRQVWDRFYKDFSFHPSVHPKDWPSIHTNKPLYKLNIESFWGDAYEHKTTTFLQKAIDAFVTITSPGEKIYALDWQHDSFLMDIRQLTLRDMVDSQNGEPLISFIPDGDYYIFLTPDFENVWFGHPWERSVTLIGDKLIKAFTENESQG